MHLVVKENTVSSRFSGNLRWPIVNIAFLMSLRSDCGLFLLPSDRKASCLPVSSLCAKLTGSCDIYKQQPLRIQKLQFLKWPLGDSYSESAFPCPTNKKMCLVQQLRDRILQKNNNIERPTSIYLCFTGLTVS